MCACQLDLSQQASCAIAGQAEYTNVLIVFIIECSIKLERHLHTMGEIVSLFSYMWKAYISVHLYTLVHVPMCHDAGCTYMFYAKRC